jgi:hypothetical protein
MIELSSSTIKKSCRIVRNIFPPSFILQILKDVTGDQTLLVFPRIKKFECANLNGKQTRSDKITQEMIEEMTNYFCEKQDTFLNFLKSLTSRAIKSGTIGKNKIDDFIMEVNPLLLDDSKIRIEPYEAIHKLVQNRLGQESYLNINVPDYIEDYFSEALDCLSQNLHRSCILFCTFALEGSLRCKYADMVDRNRAYSSSLKFSRLIDWGIENKLIENEDFYKAGMDFIREYRNNLAHFNRNKTAAIIKISREHARTNAKLIISLVELLINNIFF